MTKSTDKHPVRYILTDAEMKTIKDEEPYYRCALSAFPKDNAGRLDWTVEALFRCLMIGLRTDSQYYDEDWVEGTALKALSLALGMSVSDVEDEIISRTAEHQLVVDDYIERTQG
jgi:hypothetical protein